MFFLTRNKRKNTNNKKLYILCILLIVSLIILYFLSSFMFNKFRVKHNFEKQALSISEGNASDTFSIDKIILYSSANAKSNYTNRNLWNLDVYQFTDIGIYLNNNSKNGLNSENTVKNLYIDNINFTGLEKGSPSLYYQNVNNFGISELNDENKIDSKLDFNIIDSNVELDTSKPNYYNTCQTPITLEFVNNNIKSNSIIPNSGESLNFDGSLLSKTNIPINSIKCNVSFNINIVNNLDELFVYNVNFQIPLENNEKNIYDGFIFTEINNISNSKFLKIKQGD